jgi:hypothetical protein
MPLEPTIADISDRLRQGRFPNEQSISQGIVLRTLQELAIVHSAVQFEASFEGKSVLSLAPSDLHGRLKDLWGSEAAGSRGNSDSMHVTNAVPQMQTFNAGQASRTPP